jgi:hypothetical protein
MLTWFTEDSFVPLITGSLLVVAFLGLAITQYSRAMFLLALGIALVTAMIVAVESYIVTDKEAIESQVRRLGKAVEKHDVETIVNAISPQREGVRARARDTMNEFAVHTCRLIDFTDFKLDLCCNRPGD